MTSQPTEEWNAADHVVDEASEQSFPASDPPSWMPTHAGPPHRSRSTEPPADATRAADPPQPPKTPGRP